MTIKTLALALVAGLCLCGATPAAGTPIPSASVNASSTYYTYHSIDLINGSDLSGGLHDGLYTNKWMTDWTPIGWLVFDLGSPYDVDSASIWDYGPGCCGGSDRPTKNLGIFASIDRIG